MMKALRHAKIKDIIDSSIIETQEDLTCALRRQGIEITQATVSRDIKELMLMKIPLGDGRYKYACPTESSVVFSKERLTRMFRDSVVGMDFSENIIVIKTLPGTANAVASALDCMKWPEIIGTVAGDDNILAVVKPKEAVSELMRNLRALGNAQ